MNSLTELSTWREVLLQTATELARATAFFVPKLLGVALILLVGWLLARGVEWLARHTLRLLGIDRAPGHARVSEVLDRAGLRRAPSEMVAKLLFWLVLLAFLLSTAQTLGLDAVTATTDRFAAYVPDVIGAVLTVLIGLLVARFTGTVVGSTAAAAGLPSAARLGFLARMLVAGLVAVLAIEQLGVSTDVLMGPLTALVAAAGFAAGLAFALGAHPIVTHILAGHFLKQSLPRDVFVEVSGERGIVERVGATDTLLRSGDRTWSVPNGRLIGEVVIR